jgi:hypothetical protein
MCGKPLPWVVEATDEALGGVVDRAGSCRDAQRGEPLLQPRALVDIDLDDLAATRPVAGQLLADRPRR